jgi:hypothetical protein
VHDLQELQEWHSVQSTIPESLEIIEIESGMGAARDLCSYCSCGLVYIRQYTRIAGIDRGGVQFLQFVQLLLLSFADGREGIQPMMTFNTKIELLES